MLTLTRKEGDAIQIGDNVRVIIRACHRNSVRIAIEAPREVQIWRCHASDPWERPPRKSPQSAPAPATSEAPVRETRLLSVVSECCAE